jgi:ABC-type lipoprotein release transport system permease subunit
MPEQFEFPPRGGVDNGEPAAVFLPIAFSPFERQEFGGMYNNRALTRVMAGLLYEIRPTDAATFAGAAAVLAVAASLIPAWRATRVDPLSALRAE